MKSVWTGSIGFGLVNIPVKLYTAIEERIINLDMLDKKDLSNIKFKRVNEHTGKEVAFENIVKGYLMNDRYVVLDDKDFQKATPEKTSHLEITQFVNEKEIDSIYFEQPYYIEPDKTGSRSYALLCEALSKSGKAGVGKFVMRNREHVCIIKPMKNMLILNRIRFSHEIRDVKELEIPAAKSKPAEIKMAVTLINSLTKKFNPAAFKDDYTVKMMQIIKAKSKGRKVPYKPMKVVHSKASDLMEQLKASLNAVPKRKAS